MFEDILHFWFDEIDNKHWWIKDADFDDLIKDRFGHIHEQASQCELWHWRETARGRLAEIIVLDQFSRNIYRDHPLSFASDAQALTLAQEAVVMGHDKTLSSQERGFLYMPYMHSESKAIHEQAVDLFVQLESKDTYEFELKHKAIIEQFGRYPHRNDILDRKSTDEEIEFLSQPGSRF